MVAYSKCKTILTHLDNMALSVGWGFVAAIMTIPMAIFFISAFIQLVVLRPLLYVFCPCLDEPPDSDTMYTTTTLGEASAVVATDENV